MQNNAGECTTTQKCRNNAAIKCVAATLILPETTSK